MISRGDLLNVWPLASHPPALSVEPVKNTESKVHPWPVESGLMFSTRLQVAPARALKGASAVLDYQIILSFDFPASALLFALPVRKLSLAELQGGWAHTPPWADLSPGQWQVGGSLCGLILGLETKGRWCAFRNTQGEMENPSFGHFHTEKDQRKKNLSAFWNLEDR